MPAAITTATVPTDLANGTSIRCTEYHQVAINEICSLLTVKMSISLVNFHILNPEVNSTSCNNLIPGEFYCVRAVGDVNTYSSYEGATETKYTYWDFPSAMNATSTSMGVSAITTLPVSLGTVSHCAQYEKYYNPGANRSNT
ncbi:hypothetical protein N7447_006337 [Penicillium robsamsonii]|uniref:uncharacterized protein n=1 Tax=Penicillium robsamsonii TaxID=1792511 RepID=UPI002547A191|nr:uncharacterized protein N7447_006337 [Penicillium robsamsonii]KAJ5823997.1 hypothetical protein N7447_006337 [Penicillium robsamsonii]